MKHYSPQLLGVLTDHSDKVPSLHGFKPTKGLWFARGDDWIDWCEGQDWFPSAYKHAYELESYDAEKVLWITDPNDFVTNFCFSPRRVDWKKLYDNYHGMYVPSVRDWNLPTIFSTVDVDSLVFWNPTTVTLRYAGPYGGQDVDIGHEGEGPSSLPGESGEAHHLE